MLKVYGIAGHTTSIIKVPFNRGRAFLECEFKHGHIGSGLADRPATYATRNPAHQFIIENSRYFGGLIKLVRVTKEAEDDAVAAAKPVSRAAETVEVTPEPVAPVAETPAKPAIVEHPEIKTIEEAKVFLKRNKAKATNLVDEAHIKSYMSKIGVSFPNLEW